MSSNTACNINSTCELESALEQSIHCGLQTFTSGDLDLSEKPGHGHRSLLNMDKLRVTVEVYLEVNTLVLGAKQEWRAL